MAKYARLFVLLVCGLGLVVACLGCSNFGGGVKIPELQPGDRIVVQFDRAERKLEDGYVQRGS